MSNCSQSDCGLPTFKNSDECILHCSKDGLDFFKIRLDFFKALQKYVADNKTGEKEFCHFFNMGFPKPDTQSKYNYVGILKTVKQIHFDNCHFFTSYIEIDESQIFFQDCSFHEEWTMFNYDLLENLDNVIYQDCKFSKKVSTYTSGGSWEEKWMCKYNHSQFDHTCEFNDDVIFSRAIFDQPPFAGNQENYKENNFRALLFEECSFSAFEMYLLNQKNGVIQFKRCEFESKLKIRSVELEDYECQQSNKSKLKALKIIDCQVKENAYLRIGFLNVADFELSNLRNPKNSELNIGDCQFGSFQLRNFRNLGKFKLYKINILGHEKGSLFQIDNTSIGDADFQAICLTSFSTVKLFDNILTNINYTNMQWKEVIEVGEFNGIGITKTAKKRDTYRVLKNVAQRNNDQPQALLFYAKEMEQHKKLTIDNRCQARGFERYFLIDIFCKGSNGWFKEGRLLDIITLIFNEKTNNFGLNWWQPIKWVLFLSIAFYGMLLFSLDAHLNSELWKHIFVFVNPAHRVEFILKGQWSNLSYIIDFTYRIFEGLLIYQTVVAFRKFSRK